MLLGNLHQRNKLKKHNSGSKSTHYMGVFHFDVIEREIEKVNAFLALHFSNTNVFYQTHVICMKICTSNQWRHNYLERLVCCVTSSKNICFWHKESIHAYGTYMVFNPMLKFLMKNRLFVTSLIERIYCVGLAWLPNIHIKTDEYF